MVDRCRAHIEAELVDNFAPLVNYVVGETVGAVSNQPENENRIDDVVDVKVNTDMEDVDLSSETSGSDQESVDDSENDFE